MDINLAALRTRAPASPSLARYDQVAQLLTGRSNAKAEDGARWVHDLVGGLQIPSLGTYGVTRADARAIVDASAKASSMKANPIVLTTEELDAILARAL
jgi:alcohol dehydrogenase class IV